MLLQSGAFRQPVSVVLMCTGRAVANLQVKTWVEYCKKIMFVVVCCTEYISLEESKVILNVERNENTNHCKKR